MSDLDRRLDAARNRTDALALRDEAIARIAREAGRRARARTGMRSAVGLAALALVLTVVLSFGAHREAERNRVLLVRLEDTCSLDP